MGTAALCATSGALGSIQGKRGSQTADLGANVKSAQRLLTRGCMCYGALWQDGAAARGAESHIGVGADVFAVFEPQRRHAPQVGQLHQDEAAHLRCDAGVSSSHRLGQISQRSGRSSRCCRTRMQSADPVCQAAAIRSSNRRPAHRCIVFLPRPRRVPVQGGQNCFIRIELSIEHRTTCRTL